MKMFENVVNKHEKHIVIKTQSYNYKFIKNIENIKQGFPKEGS